MKLKNIITGAMIIAMNLALIIFQLWNFFIIWILIQSICIGIIYYLFLNQNNFTQHKINTINLKLTLLGVACFVGMLFLPNVLSLMLSNVFGLCFGILIINYNHVKEISYEN